MSELHELAFRPLPLKSIRPSGWLKQQLQIQRDGLSGNLHKFWPDIKDSAWFGGEAEGWERATYWLDGVIPLAYLLDDDVFKCELDSYMDYILTHQDDDGWLGPKRIEPGQEDNKGAYDMWAVLLILKVLAVYHDASGDERALDAAERVVAMLECHLKEYPLFNWGESRWFEGVWAIYYLYEQRGNADVLNCARLLIEQGFDWRALIRGREIEECTPIRNSGWARWRHVVNLAMAVKAYGLVSRLSGDKSDRTFCNEMMARLDELHGQATGLFSGDECVSGKSPIRGTELCAVVEYMFSLETMAAILNDTTLSDRLEQITFNALPATFTPDMWGHQYDQQANQVLCSINPDHQWSTNSPDSNIMGVEPTYGCCTSNLSQGWPKFAAHLWMRTPTDGFAAIAYAPCIINETKEGIPVRVEVETDYPFRDEITISVTTEGPVTFDLNLRIPGWCDNAELSADWETVAADCSAGTRVVIDREWNGTATIRLRLPMEPRTEHRYNNAVIIHRGPLLYSLKIGEDWRRVNEDLPGREPPHPDWEIHPTTPWNFALDLDADIAFTEAPLGDCPFSPEGSPVVATTAARLMPEWGMVRGWADQTPDSPVSPEGTHELITLIPYGCATLRVTEFPWFRGGS